MSTLQTILPDMQIEPVEQNVDRLVINGKVIYLVGTAHISQASADLAQRLIAELKPDTVAVELCQGRFDSLTNPDRWKEMDIVTILRDGKAYVLLVQLMLAGFQRKLGSALKVNPGAEMMTAVKAAEDVGASIVLADRDIRTTLKRTWGNVGILSMGKLIYAMTGGLFSKEQASESEIERLKSGDALEELLQEFSDILPDVRTTLIDERDQYLAQKIRTAPGEVVVAVVGAGHTPGIKRCIQCSSDITTLEQLPKPRRLGKIVGWIIPLLIAGTIAYGFWSAGFEKGISLVSAWFWINSSLTALGALLACAHPFTIMTAFIVAPFTSLSPLVGAGWVAALVEAMLRRPRVKDLEIVSEDIVTWRGWWHNRLIRIFLVLLLTSLFGAIGTLLGGAGIIAGLQR